jgi:hypothetical protein
MKKRLLGILIIVSTINICTAQKKKSFQLKTGQPIMVACDISEDKVVKTALDLLDRDCQNVFSSSITANSVTGDIIVGTIDKSNLIAGCGVDISKLKNKKQAFILAVSSKGKLIVAGSDKLGTAYGIMEISRLIGVSPWEWWADAIPNKKELFTLSSNYYTMQSPAVEFRGIFINDEDWGLLPWSNRTYEPSTDKGRIGPRTHERIFELLLRLRANTYWPAMHESTLPFFMTEGNRETADKYGIYIGSSHCEPMACNAAGEWKRRGQGDYDYVHNSNSVYKFWEERVKEVSVQNILYTLGMRGVHDGQMQGAKTVEEQKSVLTQVIEDQRGLLKKHVNTDINQIPQVFIPYKEVLDVYNTGLKVPDDVTLIWTDDNYGYIHHFPSTEERARKGGNGVYYHISYWGRPHDYLWLSSASPALIYQQMKQAYDTGIQKIWVLNVGDIKPAEYQIELFMDMAWNMDKVIVEGVKTHQKHFLEREFGKEIGEELNPIMEEYFRLTYIRKPEYMGNTREEEKDPSYKIIKDLPWSESYINERLNIYNKLSDKVEQLHLKIPIQKREAYFQLVKYPVQASTQMNNKLLKAQLARHGKADWKESDLAYDSIVRLTQRYNKGKWNHIMDFQPRKLPVFEKVKHESVQTQLIEEKLPVIKWNGADCINSNPILYPGLGYEGKAAGIKKGASFSYAFKKWKKDTLKLEIHLLPNHPVRSDQLRFTVAVDGGIAQAISYETIGGSEEWKENVLRNQAIRKLIIPINKKATHQVVIKALDEGIVIDQILLY